MLIAPTSRQRLGSGGSAAEGAAPAAAVVAAAAVPLSRCGHRARRRRRTQRDVVRYRRGAWLLFRFDQEEFLASLGDVALTSPELERASFHELRAMQEELRVRVLDIQSAERKGLAGDAGIYRGNPFVRWLSCASALWA